MTTTEANNKLRKIDSELSKMKDALEKQKYSDYYSSINEHRIIIKKIQAVRLIIEI